MANNRPQNRKTQRPKRLSGLSVQVLVPNAITVAATCAGLTGIRFALEERWEFAVGAILIAALLDGLDGRMARLLNASSEFGAQLDSLSDFVAFGVSPAFILFFWVLGDLGGLGWAIALFLAVCCGLRLARFNSRIDTLPAYAYNYFQGVPAPAGAGLALLPIIAALALETEGPLPAAFVAFWTIGVGFLMVSELPTFSFKKFKVPGRLILPFMALIAVMIAGIAGRPWDTLFALLLIYLATIPLAFFNFSRLKKQAEALQASETAPESDDEGDDDGKNSRAEASSSKRPPLRQV